MPVFKFCILERISDKFGRGGFKKIKLTFRVKHFNKKYTEIKTYYILNDVQCTMERKLTFAPYKYKVDNLLWY